MPNTNTNGLDERTPDDAVEDDARLLQCICEGQQAAFAVLVQRYAQRFYRVAYRFIGRRTDAEDIVQDAFVKLWERPQMWQAEKNVAFTTWFHRVVINRCLDYQKKKRPSLLIDDTWIQDERETQEEIMMHNQQQRLVETQIAALPERQRIALNLCFYEELSNQEAAQVMGLHLKALQSLLMRAKMTLKENLKGHIGG